MKKIISLLFCLSLLFALNGCSNVKMGNSGPISEQQSYDEEWQRDFSSRPTKRIAPLVSKTVVFSDCEQKDEEDID